MRGTPISNAGGALAYDSYTSRWAINWGVTDGGANGALSFSAARVVSTASENRPASASVPILISY